MKYGPLTAKLREIVGEKAFWELTREMPGCTVYIPTEKDARIRHKDYDERNNEIVNRIKELGIKYPEKSRRQVEIMVSKEYELSYPRISQIYIQYNKSKDD